MALELSTIGIKLNYLVGTSATTVPTSGTWTEIADITSIGEISATPDQLECTNLTDTWKRYVAGVKDSSGNVAIGANFTKAFQSAWATARSAYLTAFAAGNNFWWEVEVPNFGKFHFTGEPAELGVPSIEVNNVFTGSVNITPNLIDGWTMDTTS